MTSKSLHTAAWRTPLTRDPSASVDSIYPLECSRFLLFIRSISCVFLVNLPLYRCILSEGRNKWLIGHSFHFVSSLSVLQFGVLFIVIWSYLQDRDYFVSGGNHESEQTKITYGVPQGSILGPLFYSTFTGSSLLRLCNIIPHLSIHMQMTHSSI